MIMKEYEDPNWDKLKENLKGFVLEGICFGMVVAFGMAIFVMLLHIFFN
tara:strand:- start:62 stop:208 length:147 start_codon:yes stop_codon:yes gene_type:complete